MVWIALFGFLPGDHGRSCEVCEAHPYGCGNTLIEGEGNGVGRLVRLRLVEKVHLAIEFHQQPEWDSGMMDQKLAGNDMKYSTKKTKNVDKRDTFISSPC